MSSGWQGWWATVTLTRRFDAVARFDGSRCGGRGEVVQRRGLRRHQHGGFESASASEVRDLPPRAEKTEGCGWP